MKKLNNSEVLQIIKRYKLGESSPSLAKSFNISSNSVLSLLKTRNIARRSLTNARRLYKFNEDAFRIINSESAYWIGFLAADGCIYQPKTKNMSPEIMLNLSKKDQNHLLKFKNFLKSEHPLKQKINKSKLVGVTESVLFSLRSKKLVKDLAKYGVTPRKTFTSTFPDNIPLKYQKDFIRGVFDGDGSCSESKSKDGYLSKNWNITGTAPLLLGIQEYLIKTTILNKTKLGKHPSKGIFVLSYGGRKNLEKIYNTLYKNSRTHLERKKYKLKRLIIKH